MISTEETHKQFTKLLDATCKSMDDDIFENYEFYRNNSGKKMELIVVQNLQAHAKGTIFENEIRLANSDREFPDIIIGNIYGVEVKTSNSSWKSVGSSIMESTRVYGIEKIYIFFGNLSPKEAGFKVKLYENSLNNIAVTHSPRYSIDMKLEEDETIFKKMDTTYDEFRSDDDPTGVLKKYYRKILPEGQTLWWLGNEVTTEPSVLTMWNVLDKQKQNELIVQGLCQFPELIDGDKRTKYNRMSFWLVMEHGIIPHALRDKFSSGGKVDITVNGEPYRRQPQVLNLLNENKKIIKKTIKVIDSEKLKEFWDVTEVESGRHRVAQWINEVCKRGQVKIDHSILKKIFS